MTFEEEFPSINPIDCRIAHGGMRVDLDTKEVIHEPHYYLVPGDIMMKHCLDKSELSKIIFKGDVSGFEKEIVQEIIDRFNLRKGDYE